MTLTGSTIAVTGSSRLRSSHVIPAMVRKFAEARDRGEPRVVLWGDGSPTREFLHVRDAARAFGLALERYDGPKPDRARALLGFEAAVALREGIADLVAWYHRSP